MACFATPLLRPGAQLIYNSGRRLLEIKMSRHEQYKNIQFEAGLLNDLERYLAENELVLAEKEVAAQESTAKEETAIESTTKEGAAKERAAKEDYFKGILAGF